MSRISFVLLFAASLTSAVPASAQSRAGERAAQNESAVDRSILTVPDDAAEHRARNGSHGSYGSSSIPRGHLPPRGMCRIWIDGVAPGRQPQPTDCRTAMRNRPRNARVISSDGTSYPASRTDRRDCILRDRDGDILRDRRGNVRYDEDCRRDRDRHQRDDGWGDDDWYDRDRNDRDDYCLDRNRDGRCDVVNGRDPYDRDIARQYPTTMPRMVAAILLEQGIRSPEARRWLGDARVTSRYTDYDRDRVPERITWLDSAGRIAQLWTDTDRDGRADRIELYREGRRVHVVR